ncbi:MAG: hypothetical protein AAFY14_09705 [Pseudomonadota bacterium]
MRLTASLLLMTSLSTLAACSSGGGGGDAAEQSRLFFGSTDPNTAANGVAFADDQTEIEDLAGTDIKVQLIQTPNRTGQDVGTLTVSDSVLNFIDANNFTVSIDGQEVEFVNGLAEGPDGQRLFGSVINDDFSGEVSIRQINGNGFGASFASVFGAETNPQEIEARSGSVTYETRLSVEGRVDGVGSNTSGSLFADMTLEADFTSATISGNGNGQLISSGGTTGGGLEAAIAAPPIPIAFDVAPGAIAGNGFVADLNVTGCGTEAICNADAEIGGVFFGPNADEVAGLATIDLEIVDADGGIVTFEGGGAFTDAPVAERLR